MASPLIRMLRLWGLLLLFLGAGPLLAQQGLEVLPLQHRSVEEVLPVLRPLVEPGGSLSGMNNQLFLRASERNRAEIRKALAAMDVPARRLVIRVATDLSQTEQYRGGRVQGSLGNDRVRIGNADTGGSNQVRAQVYDSRSASSGGGTQMVQTVDGGRAYIQVGTSLAMPMRQVVLGPGGAVVSETVEYRDVGRGFYAEPRLRGDRVSVEISQQSDAPGRRGDASIQVQRLSTTVSGRLGEWLQLGGTGQEASSRRQGTLSLSTSEVRENRGIWLMVEELP
ncbi:secretin N-terminal domain-containing protein [Azovibrio restrictus]|uniref:secretin N-terminal domain-containing protein n=1 Tax=Azovibrio restrictus TaxID=146938 RepID=UPI0026EF05F4|nr:secretin N-terminal domain-containing protein [Azovibrio restrictus]MDD3483027.1 secretin N-terminal domain-containing protein [Azovibrio restrictus]